MLTAYPESNTRRSVYAILLFLAVVGPAVLIALAIKDARAHWIEVTAFFAGIVGIPLLCIWSAVYVGDEPQRVRIALIWIAALFLFLLGVMITHPTIQ
jgi:peptidoglycan/LPS O-acetylase OafA/YrhL